MITPDLLPTLTAWLHQHPHLAILAAGCVAFLESLAIIGSIIPGSITLTAIGILIGTGVIPLWHTFVSAIIGAIAGDLLSYWVGFHYQESLTRRWPFTRYPNMIARGEAFFHQHGGKSIAIGRFFGPIRAILPLVAGMLNMPFNRFIIAELISGVLWAPLYMLPGILIGAATLELAPAQATRLIFILLGALLCIWFVLWLSRHCWTVIVTQIEKTCLMLWLRLPQHITTRWLYHLLSNPKRGRQHMQMLRLIMAIVCLMVLLTLAWGVCQQDLITQWNQPIFHFLQNLRTPVWDHIMVAITLLGDKYFIITFVVALTCIFLYYGHYSLAFYWVLNTLLVTALAYLFKMYIDFPRPSGILVIRSSSSFPSFHTAFATAVYSFLSRLVVQQRGRTWRKVTSISLCVLLTLIGFSRLYLGAHWFTDVLAGYSLGMTCGLIVLMTYHRCRRQAPKQLRHLAGIYAISISLSYLAVAHFLFPLELHRNQRFYPKHVIRFSSWWHQTLPVMSQFRRSRTGAVDVPFNVQWSGKLSRITQTLQEKHWQIVPPPTLLKTLFKIVQHDNLHTLPIWPALYNGHQAQRIMTFQIDAVKPLVVLRLWRANTQFSDVNQPLWIGTLHYRKTWGYWPHTPPMQSLPPVENWLMQSLNPSRYRLTTSASKHPLLLIQQN